MERKTFGLFSTALRHRAIHCAIITQRYPVCTVGWSSDIAYVELEKAYSMTMMIEVLVSSRTEQRGGIETKTERDELKVGMQRKLRGSSI